MSKAKSIIAICVGLLALTAFASSSASAASWKVNGALLSGSAALANTAAVDENGKLTFSEITVECNGSSLEGISPQITHPDSGSASSLVFSACKTVAGSSCTLVGTKISTVPITALVSTVGTLEVSVVFKPKTKTTFATIEFTGASCSIANEVQPVTGQATVKGPTGQDERTLQQIVANTTSGELKVGSSAAVLKGAALLQLASKLGWSYR